MMLTDKSKIPLEIEPVNPGFIVREAATFDHSRWRPSLFACTTLDEALGFIRSRLASVGAASLAAGKPITATISDPAFTHTFSGGGNLGAASQAGAEAPRAGCPNCAGPRMGWCASCPGSQQEMLVTTRSIYGASGLVYQSSYGP